MKESNTSFIIDCEVVAYDKEKDKIRPFQILSTRGRKNIKKEDIKVQVCLYAFDMLYLNGKSYLREHLKARREALHSGFVETKGSFYFAKHLNSNKMEEIQEFLKESVGNNCEGLMVKSLEKDSTYEPSRRTFKWLKVKKDYLQGLGDSFDLVVIGGYLGRGKRTGGYGGFLLACYDPEGDEYQSICKIGTGFSDEHLQQFTKEMNKHKIDKAKSYYKFGDSVKPDVFFDAKVVWEILAADLTISPVHKAAIGLVEDDKGIALRFPRFVRVRDDKKPEQATNSEQVADAFRSQASAK